MIPMDIIIVLFLIGLPMYFLPSIIANCYKKSQMLAIFLLNLLLGWTIIGWIVALIWAVIKENKE